MWKILASMLGVPERAVEDAVHSEPLARLQLSRRQALGGLAALATGKFFSIPTPIRYEWGFDPGFDMGRVAFDTETLMGTWSRAASAWRVGLTWVKTDMNGVKSVTYEEQDIITYEEQDIITTPEAQEIITAVREKCP